MRIHEYREEYAEALISLLRREGEDWQDYYEEEGRENFLKTLRSSNSICFVAITEESLDYTRGSEPEITGFIRCIKDGELGIYLMDILVDKDSRGQSLGRELMIRVSEEYPEYGFYVLSDEDGYYEKQGFEKIGSIYEIDFQ